VTTRQYPSSKISLEAFPVKSSLEAPSPAVFPAKSTHWKDRGTVISTDARKSLEKDVEKSLSQ